MRKRNKYLANCVKYLYEYLERKEGLIQARLMFHSLFKIYLEKIFREVNEKVTGDGVSLSDKEWEPKTVNVCKLYRAS